MDKIENLKTTLIILIVFCIGFVTGAMVYDLEIKDLEYKQMEEIKNEN